MVVCNQGATEGKSQRLCENLIRFLLVIGKTIPSIYLFLAFIKPDLPIFPTSLLNSSTSTAVSVTVRVAWMLPMLYIVATWWSNLLFLGTYFLAYIFSTLDAIDNLM